MSGIQTTRVKLRTGFVAASALLAAGFVAGSAQAQVPGKLYFGIGAGGGIIIQNNPCPDVPCNTGDVCTCVMGSGSASFKTLSAKSTPIPATFTIQVNGDNNYRVNNGGGGGCYPSTGILVLTVNSSIINLPFSGPACRLGTAAGRNAFGVSVPAYIESGTGRYATAIGTGTLAATFDPDGGTVLLTLDGYGDFKSGN